VTSNSYYFILFLFYWIMLKLRESKKKKKKKITLERRTSKSEFTRRIFSGLRSVCIRLRLWRTWYFFERKHCEMGREYTKMRNKQLIKKLLHSTDVKIWWVNCLIWSSGKGSNELSFKKSKTDFPKTSNTIQMWLWASNHASKWITPLYFFWKIKKEP